MYFNKQNISWIVVLAILFFVSYGAVNHLTAYMDSIKPVQSIMFYWEKWTPFIPIFIIPYMSIDFLYGLAFFIIKKDTYNKDVYKKIINGLGIQLLVNQFFSLLCFLSFPLKCSFEKPEIPSLYKPIFDSLLSFDLVYNQAPSLHISILVILTVFYNQHLKNILFKWILNVWFLLIGLSVSFTFQHHFIDVILGGFLGLSVVILFNYSPKHKESFHLKRKYNKNKFILISLIVSSVLFILPILNNFNVIDFKFNNIVYITLLVSFISVITVFKVMLFGNGFNVRDDMGHFTKFFKSVAFVYLYIRGISLYFWNCYKTPIKIKESLFVGSLLSIKNNNEEEDHLYINVAWECENKKINNISLPLVDFSLASKEQLSEIAKTIKDGVVNNKKVYVHCALGFFRTILAIGAYFIIYEKESPESFLNLINNSEIPQDVKSYVIKNKEIFLKILSFN